MDEEDEELVHGDRTGGWKKRWPMEEEVEKDDGERWHADEHQGGELKGWIR